MLDGTDKETFHALHLLRDVVDRRQKPVVIWVGGGASMWCGFSDWLRTAERFHARYVKFESQYDRHGCLRLLKDRKFPELFEIFQRTNRQRYNQELVSLFATRPLTPVYARFLDIIKHIAPLHVVTTNVDETLEHNLPGATTVQRSDIERCPRLLARGDSFVAKLHGSIGAVATTVFSTTDYQNLSSDIAYSKTLGLLFGLATVVFVGYSLRDTYVLELLAAGSATRRLFGDGPHFLVASSRSAALPDSIRLVRYIPEPNADHRSAITVLDIIRVVREGRHVWFNPESEPPRSERRQASAYFISDITPPGTWTSGQSLELGGGSGPKLNAVVGQGFENSELPEKTSPAMHDLTVGLVSFDRLYFPLASAAILHDLLESARFWDLVGAGIFRFIYFERDPVMMFRSIDSVEGGDIGWINVPSEGGSPPSVAEQIRKQFRPVPGKESEVDRLFESLQANVSVFDSEKFNVPALTRGALLHPSVRRLLGISDAVIPTYLPRWARFPVLRLAHTIRAGCACEDLALPSTKIGFGSEILVGAAFAVAAARDWADSVSSYVLTAQFNTELGAYVQSNPSVLTAILKFRDTPAGVSLRREILDELATSAGSEFAASVNGGLRRLVPSTVMESARNRLSALLFRNDRDSNVVPAVWTSVRNSDSIARLWRERSRNELKRYCRSRGIRKLDPCPCGSGEQLRFCCAVALRG